MSVRDKRILDRFMDGSFGWELGGPEKWAAVSG